MMPIIPLVCCTLAMGMKLLELSYLLGLLETEWSGCLAAISMYGRFNVHNTPTDGR